MKAVIVAAGMGTRIRPLSNEIPKAFIEIGDVPLIIRSLDNLNSIGIKDVIIVVGYMEEYFRTQLGSNFKEIKITYVLNNEYANTGSMYSLSQTEGIIDDDILLLESDLLYEQRALDILINSPEPSEILVAPLSGSGDEVYIIVNNENELIDLGKNIMNKTEAIGELVGISKLSLKFLSDLYKKAKEDYQRNENNYHYEESIFKLSKTYPIKCKLIENLSWIEIDNYKDLKIALEEIYPKIKENKKDYG